MRQREVLMLSYALDPFQMERKKDKVIIPSGCSLIQREKCIHTLARYLYLTTSYMCLTVHLFCFILNFPTMAAPL